MENKCQRKQKQKSDPWQASFLYSPPRAAVLRIRICQIRVQYFHGHASSCLLAIGSGSISFESDQGPDFPFDRFSYEKLFILNRF